MEGMLTDLWVILVRRCDRQEEKACGGQGAISAFRDLRVFLEKEGKGGCPVLSPTLQGWHSPFMC